MAKILLLVVALCALLSFSAARSDPHSDRFLLQGCAYCDTCRCGFETDASKPSVGATVRVECRNRKTSKVTYTKEGVTDSAGQYNILVEKDCGDDYCDAVLVKSADSECNVPDAGRDRARVILTSNNGMPSRIRYANAMGFLKNTPLDSCSTILRKYQESEEV